MGIACQSVDEGLNIAIKILFATKAGQNVEVNKKLHIAHSKMSLAFAITRD